MHLKLFPEYPKSLIVTLLASMTALVCVATILFVLYIPATGGYFNLGEAIIYIAALLFGPVIGGFAGGVGAAIADLIVAPIYAPGTLVIKFIEGFIIGLLAYNINPRVNKKLWRYLGVIIGIIVSLVIGLIGTFFLSEEWEIGLFNLGTITISISSLIWIIIGVVAGILIVIGSLKFSIYTGFFILSILIGGLVIVFGYFLYEWLLYGYAALIEIPLNIGQVIIGLIISVPISKTIKRSIPSLADVHRKDEKYNQ
ncbi:MAG: hypothetical protein GF329_03965 [Candidatus Lokiarchaeota archaeon]|nr:hypothetical protein [Candidatus Lokiarchaeota archaeon]